MKYRHGPFECMAWDRGFWFRVFGYGLHVKLRAGHVPLFSERYGYVSVAYIGPLRFMALRPSRPLN